MLKFIENLRDAPNETKKTFAIVVSVFTTFVIVGFSLAVSNPLLVEAEKDDVKTAEEKLPSPFSVLASQIGTSFNGLKNDLAPLKGMISAVKEEMKATTTRQNIVATTTVKIIPTVATTTKVNKVIPKSVPVAPKKVEPKYGPFLIPGIKVNKANMGAMAIMTIGKEVTATTIQSSSTVEIPIRPGSGQETATST
jgi:hypothetical protein